MSYKISYEVPGIIDVIAQPSSMSCWATVVTMLQSWKYQECSSIENVMDSLGSDFRSIYDANTGLAPDRIQDLADASGMVVEYQCCETPQSILQFLETYGPIIIIDDEDPTASFAVHARIIKGIYGGGEAENSYLIIIDPATGTVYYESFQNFESKYEAMAAANGWNLQMMHY
jgi:ABC-type bacteriocin/lantibiotic exporter with double-glycine peptidase domain